MYSEKFLLVLASVLICNALALESLDNEWKLWQSNYGKKYSTPREEEYRRKIWESNWHMVTEHNQQANQGNATYRMKMNHFADKSEKELAKASCFRLPTPEERNLQSYREVNYGELPPSVDWREENCVTGVKNQGSFCGSCWAFATVGTIESRYCIKSGKLIEFSEQQLVDCDHSNFGCCGGFPLSAFEYAVQYGLMKSSNYKYKGHGTECRYKERLVMSLNSSKFYDLSGEENMASALAIDGPMSVAFAVAFPFYFYSEGIFDGWCAGGLNHAMLAVGYGVENHEQYWIVKNSWGDSWGDDGYVKIRRNVNQCMIGMMASAADLM
uniref:Ervatamin-B-like n=1 Tax=Geotrypetes seraphini TaxID=260995 RepID=A0A6P8NWL3_GEOSA|nr:ervatamin-B-like [Geotrypetes seraphini]